MLFRDRLLYGLYGLLGLYVSTELRADYMLLQIVNQSGGSVFVFYDEYVNGSPTVINGVVDNIQPGQTWNGSLTVHGYPADFTLKPEGFGNQSLATITANAQSRQATVGAPPATNHYCYIHIVWTNTHSKYAIAMPMITNQQGEHFPWGGDSWAVQPGGVVDTWLTNVICGTLSFGDTRDGNPTPDFVGDMTEGTAQSQPPNTDGNAPNVGTNQNPIPYPPFPIYGTTNGATSADIYAAAGSLKLAIAELEKTTAFGLSNVVGAVNLDRYQSVTNTDRIISAITNSYGDETNGSILSSNVYAIRTNLMHMVTNLVAMSSRDLNRGSNNAWVAGQALEKATNFFETASNLVSGVLGQLELADHVATLETARNSLRDALDVVPAASFGLLSVGNQIWDLKTVLSGEAVPVGAATVQGMWPWVRAILVWGALIACMSIYIYQIKQGLVNVLTIQPVTVPADAAGFISEVPGVNFTIRTMTVIALMAFVVLLPSTAVALMSTVASGLGYGSIAAGIAGPGILNIPSAVTNTFGGINTFLPLLEWVVMGLNMAIGQWVLDFCVSTLLVYSKALGW